MNGSSVPTSTGSSLAEVEENEGMYDDMSGSASYDDLANTTVGGTSTGGGGSPVDGSGSGNEEHNSMAGGSANMMHGMGGPGSGVGGVGKPPPATNNFVTKLYQYAYLPGYAPIDVDQSSG